MESVAQYRAVSDFKMRESFSSICSFLRREFTQILDPLEIVPEHDANQKMVAKKKSSAKTGPFVELEVDESSNIASYVVENDFGLVAVLQSSLPLSSSGSFGYFEVFIISAGSSGSIGIGLAPNDHEEDQQPGWKSNSFGYHGDDGNKYWSEKGCCKNDRFGPSFSTGDVIGCGINNVTRSLFFTKNGYVIDSAFSLENVSIPLFPTVGLASSGERVFVNFGQLPFLWNFDIENILPEFDSCPKAEYFHPKTGKKKREQSIFDIYFDWIASRWGILEVRPPSSSSLKFLRKYLDESFELDH